jgi:hypothetical protein
VSVFLFVGVYLYLFLYFPYVPRAKILCCRFKQITEVEFSGGKDLESKHQKVFLNTSCSLVDYSG